MSNAEYHPCETRERQLECFENETVPPLSQCKHCSPFIKINLSALTVGVGEHPRMTSNEKSVGRDQSSVLDGTTQFNESEAYDGTFERCQDDWRNGVGIIPETYRYLEEARQPYSKEQVERVSYLGTQLVQKAGGFAKSGIQLQELRMRSLETSRKTIEEYSYLYPAIADQVMGIFTKGVNPLMRPQKVPTGENDTLPHQRSMANIILKTLRVT